jgi:hypothetical protein
MATRLLTLSPLVVLLLLAACGGSGGLDTSAAGLTALVRSGEYKSWKAEPQVHPSTGPHSNVRSYVNDVLYASLKAGNAVHPRGSVVVKELYISSTEVSGHAVDVKEEGSGQWVFFEGFAPAYSRPYYYRGTSNLCADCHANGGVDYMLTPASAFP